MKWPKLFLKLLLSEHLAPENTRLFPTTLAVQTRAVVYVHTVFVPLPPAVLQVLYTKTSHSATVSPQKLEIIY